MTFVKFARHKVEQCMYELIPYNYYSVFTLTPSGRCSMTFYET